jgi:aryl-alcohol dehydrogenase-like predicted oxidoreductase
MVNYRYLGNSGLKVSEITYGNWVTHGSQVDDSAAIATVHAALDAGITTFDTADVYANTAAEAVLGKALSGQRRESRKARVAYGSVGKIEVCEARACCKLR